MPIRFLGLTGQTPVQEAANSAAIRHIEVVDFHRPESVTLWHRFINQNVVEQLSVPRMIYVGTEFDQHVELAIIDIQDSLVNLPSALRESI